MRYIACDSETFLISPGNLAPRPVVFSWYQSPDNWAPRTPPSGLMLPDAAMNWFMEILRDQNLTLLTANGPYDMAVACNYDARLYPLVFQAYEEGRIVCVQTLQKLIDISQGCRERPRQDGTVGYSLATLVRHYKGLDRTADKEGEKSWRLRYAELDGVPLEQWPKEAVQYAENDAMDTWDVYHQQRRTYGIMPSETEQYRAAWALHLMSCQGIRTDGAKVAALKERLLRDRVANRATAQAAGFLKLTPCKPDEEAEALVPYKRGDGQRKMRWGRDMTAIKNRVRVAYAALGKEVPQTEGGGVSTDADTLDRSMDPALRALAASGTTEKLLSTYIPALEQGVNVKVNTRFNVLVDNGRTSSHKDKATGAGFNFQNFPRPNELDANAGVNFVRPCIVPTEGTYFCSIDLDAGELRSLAQVQLYLFGKSKLADVLNAGRDPHLEFAADLLSITYEEALANKKRPDVKKARQWAKCFHPDTEILTKRGWIKVSELTYYDEVAAAIPGVNAVEIVWQEPTALTTKWADSLIHLKNEGIDIRVTEDHRMLAANTAGVFKDVSPRELGAQRQWFNAGVCEDGELTYDERFLRLAVSAQADGSYCGVNSIRWGFTKERKIERMRSLLQGLPYKESKKQKSGVISFHVSGEIGAKIRSMLENKKLPWSWINLSLRLRKMVLDEAAFWDAHSVRDSSYLYFSCQQQNVDVLQAIATITGKKTRVAVQEFVDEPQKSSSHRLRIRNKANSRGDNLSATEIPHNGPVYCLSVPASYVVARDGGVPIIVGQCFNFGKPGGLGIDSMIDYARTNYGVDMTRDEAEKLNRKWERTYPEMRRYLDYISRLVGEGGARIKSFGSGMLRGDVGYTDAANHFFSNLIAQGVKDACFYIAWECYVDKGTPLYGARQVAMIHDETILELPKATAHEAAHRAAELFREHVQLRMPDVKVTASPALSLCWEKDAAPVYVEGRLVPWTKPC